MSTAGKTASLDPAATTGADRVPDAIKVGHSKHLIHTVQKAEKETRGVGCIERCGQVHKDVNITAGIH